MKKAVRVSDLFVGKENNIELDSTQRSIRISNMEIVEAKFLARVSAADRKDMLRRASARHLD